MLEVTEIISNIVIILIGLLLIVLLAILALIAWKAYGLFKYVNGQVPEFVEKAKDITTTGQKTATSLQGTANFLQDAMVAPAIKLIALVVAIGRFIQVLIGTRRVET